ncbi:MAG: hypothetical protein AB7R67_24085 [Vicinamibacterales bacterium]
MARALMLEVLAWARATGPKSLVLHAARRSPALRRPRLRGHQRDALHGRPAEAHGIMRAS